MNNRCHAFLWNMLFATFCVSAAQDLSPIVLIDDFSDSDLFCALPHKNQWNFYGYGNNGSQVTPKFEIDNETGSYMHCDFTVRQPGTISYPNFDIITLKTDTSWFKELPAPIRGIGFRYQATHSNSNGRIIIQLNSTKITDNFQYYFQLQMTGGEWRSATIPIESFTQTEGGVIQDSLDRTTIDQIEFRMIGGGNGILAVDEIAFLSDYGELITLDPPVRTVKQPVRRTSSVEAPRTIQFDARGRKSGEIDKKSKIRDFRFLISDRGFQGFAAQR